MFSPSSYLLLRENFCSRYQVLDPVTLLRPWLRWYDSRLRRHDSGLLIHGLLGCVYDLRPHSDAHPDVLTGNTVYGALGSLDLGP